MIKANRFWTKDGVAVILKPETEEQHERTIEMGRLWVINRLGNCGTYYIVEFAEQHNIPIAYQFVA